MSKQKDKKYWVCIIELEGQEFPKEVSGFDSVPRMATIEAIEEHNIEINNCWSSWGCKAATCEKIMRVWNETPEGENQ